MKWGDLLRVKAEFPINLWPNAAQAYHRWIRDVDHARTSPTTSSPASCSRPAAATSASPRSTSTARCRAGSRRAHRAGRGADVHGHARRAAGRKERLAGMAAFFSQVGYKSTGGVEGGDRLLRSREGRRRRDGPRAVVSRRHDGSRLARRQDPREVFADWLIAPEEPLVHPQHRQPRLVLAAGPRHRPRAGRHPARQPAEQSGAAGLPGEGTGRRAATT